MANEKRLINAWDLIEWLQNIDLENHLRHLRGKKSKWLDTEGVRHMIATVPTVDAVEASRLGNLGRLMMPYIGCPRGRMGARCDGRIIELDPITDVEGDIWVPVLEEDLNFLKAKAVEVVHGRWIIGTGKNALMLGYRMCSGCGEIIKTQYSLYGMFNYCPNCGADMRERKDNERKAD